MSSFIATTLANGAETFVLPSERAREERAVLGNVLLADQFRPAGGDDPLLLVGHEVASVVVGRHRRAERFVELGAECRQLHRSAAAGVAQPALPAADRSVWRMSTLLASDSAFDSWTCEPGFEHRRFQVDERLQLRLEAVAHRRFDRGGRRSRSRESSTTARIGQIQIWRFRNTPVREIVRPTLVWPRSCGRQRRRSPFLEVRSQARGFMEGGWGLGLG